MQVKLTIPNFLIKTLAVLMVLILVVAAMYYGYLKDSEQFNKEKRNRDILSSITDDAKHLQQQYFAYRYLTQNAFLSLPTNSVTTSYELESKTKYRLCAEYLYTTPDLSGLTGTHREVNGVTFDRIYIDGTLNEGAMTTLCFEKELKGTEANLLQ